jgi:hypothetical protein
VRFGRPSVRPGGRVRRPGHSAEFYGESSRQTQHVHLFPSLVPRTMTSDAAPDEEAVRTRARPRRLNLIRSPSFQQAAGGGVSSLGDFQGQKHPTLTLPSERGGDKRARPRAPKLLSPLSPPGRGSLHATQQTDQPMHYTSTTLEQFPRNRTCAPTPPQASTPVQGRRGVPAASAATRPIHGNPPPLRTRRGRRVYTRARPPAPELIPSPSSLRGGRGRCFQPRELPRLETPHPSPPLREGRGPREPPHYHTYRR